MITKTSSHPDSYKVFISVGSCLISSFSPYGLSFKTCGSSHYYSDVLEIGISSCIVFPVKLFFIGVWLPCGDKRLAALPSKVNPGYLCLLISTWMILVRCSSIHEWYVVGKIWVQLYDPWWRLSMFTDPSQFLNMRNKIGTVVGYFAIDIWLENMGLFRNQPKLLDAGDCK